MTALAALVATAVAAVGWAADKPADKSDDAANTAVPVLIRDAVAEYDAGRYEEARALFRLAHEKARRVEQVEQSFVRVPQFLIVGRFRQLLT